jgi:nitrogen regulatory protein PII
MKPMKRLEIVIDSLSVPRLLEALEGSGVHSWTRIPSVSGRGDRGDRGGGDPARAFDNDLLLVIIDVESVSRVIDSIRPLLRTYGGMCTVSECDWVIHE